MKANELRIGNYVLNSRYNEMHIVSGNTIHSMQFYDMKILEPIPLTEEWLLKFGFEKSNNNTEFYTFDLSKLSIHLKSKQYADGRTYFNSWCIIEKQIEYVHQLQNLYFALTQEELKIK